MCLDKQRLRKTCTNILETAEKWFTIIISSSIIVIIIIVIIIIITIIIIIIIIIIIVKKYKIKITKNEVLKNTNNLGQL